jgi:hypothetical protein
VISIDFDDLDYSTQILGVLEGFGVSEKRSSLRLATRKSISLTWIFSVITFPQTSTFPITEGAGNTRKRREKDILETEDGE